MTNAQLVAIKDLETFVALKRMSQYLVGEVWNTSGDIDFDYAVAKSKQFEQDICELAKLDGDLEWGDAKVKTESGAWITRREGDFNPWYSGSLTLGELLESLETLEELLDSQTPQYMGEVEFLHYYSFLKGKLPKSPEIMKLHPAVITISNLHPKIQEHCKGRFGSKHYSDAILAAYKVVFNEIKDIAGIYDLDGKQLIERSFSLATPVIKLNPLVTQSDKDEQQGFMFLLSGAAVGIRNPKAHDLVMQEDKQKALSYLAFASLLMQRLDERLEPKAS